MKTEPFLLNDALHGEAARYFSLLSNYHAKNGDATVGLRVRGYNGAMHLVADIIRTAIMALESDADLDHLHVPEPNRHISGVLAMALDLLPYEEADLLDELHRTVHNFSSTDLKKKDEALLLFAQNLISEGNYSTTRILDKNYKKSPFLTSPFN